MVLMPENREPPCWWERNLPTTDDNKLLLCYANEPTPIKPVPNEECGGRQCSLSENC